MKNKEYLPLLFCAILLSAGCRQDYNPPASANKTTNFLVVDGFIHSGNDTTVITLSRTRSLGAAPYPVAEKNAQVSLESSGGYSTPFADLNDGRYLVSQLNLDQNQQYRVNIVTADGTSYASDFVSVQASPPIDSITWKRNDTSGVLVYANTHSASSKGYYRWDYTETWERHAPDPTSLILQVPEDILTMASSQTPSVCWNTTNSQNIAIASSATLGSDIIYNAPLTSIAPNTEKIAFKYSILVRQYGLTPDAFEYWTTLKKSTELAGSLFDQEPSQIKGNIHCITRPTEPTLGYISIGNVTSQRIFISNSQVLPWEYSPACAVIPIILDSVNKHIVDDYWLPVKELPAGARGADIIGYMMTEDYCVNCTLRFGKQSGTSTKPDFWL